MKVRDTGGLIECIGFSIASVVRNLRNTVRGGFGRGYIESRKVDYAIDPRLQFSEITIEFY